MSAADYGSALRALAAGNHLEARRLCNSIETSEPGRADVQRVLGLVSWMEGDYATAASHLRAAVLSAGAESVWFNDLGVICILMQDWTGAADALARYVAAEPTDADSLGYYGTALFHLGRNREAERALSRAIELAPDRASTCELLALVYQRLQQREAYLVQATRLAELRPDARSFAQLAIARWEAGDAAGTFEANDRCRAAGAPDAEPHSAVLYLSLFDPRQTGQSLLAAHRVWASTHAPEPSAAPSFANRPDPDRLLRVGYIVSGLRDSPTYHFVGPLLRNHAADRISFRLYDTQPDAGDEFDPVRRNVRDLSLEQLRAVIQDDGIDILVDLLGHHSFNRARLFGTGAAPVQATYPNYPSTTGLRLDAIFTDIWNSPPGTEAEYSETVVRLPTGCLAYAPPNCAPPVSPLPAIRNGHVTFGLFQRASKVHDGAWDAIAAVMRQVTGSRLLFHHAGADYDLSGSLARRRVLEPLACRGIDSRRVEFRGTRPLEEHLRVLAEVDIALDSFPFNGQTTTCECLWMGVPVVTIAGNSHVARVGSSLLHQLGEPGWVAATTEGYVAAAAGLAAGIEALAAMRAELREKMAASRLTNAKARTRELEEAYTTLWRAWCQSRG